MERVSLQMTEPGNTPGSVVSEYTLPVVHRVMTGMSHVHFLSTGGFGKVSSF